MTAFSDATIAGGIGIVYHYFGGVAVVCMGFRDLHAQTYWRTGHVRPEHVADLEHAGKILANSPIF